MSTTEISFKTRGVSNTGEVLLGANQVQEVIQTIHSNFEAAIVENMPDTILGFVNAALEFGELSGSDSKWLTEFTKEYIEQLSKVA